MKLILMWDEGNINMYIYIYKNLFYKIIFK